MKDEGKQATGFWFILHPSSFILQRMSTSLDIDRHLITLKIPLQDNKDRNKIPDAEGGEVHYLMSSAPPGLDDWAILLTRTDGKGEWLVSVDGKGKWACTCPDWKHRRRKNRRHSGPCKHMVAAADLLALADLLSRKTP